LGILVMFYLQRTRVGHHVRATGSNEEIAEKLGIRTDRVRKFSIVLSTVFAAYSQILFIADYGTINVYTGHIGLETFAAASILVGGATLKRANIGNAIVGVILFHTLFVTSPMAGQNLFNNPAVGEYFRSFVAYATILIALMLNMKQNQRRMKNGTLRS
jgi:simple sugar transport system permease protein